MGLIALLLEICSLAVLLSADPDLLFANRNDIRVVNVKHNQTSSASNVIINQLEDAAAVDFVWSEGTVFWTEVFGEVIRRTVVSSGVVEDIIKTGIISPDGLACDWVGLKLYWTDADTDRIEVSHLNGTSRKVLFWENIDQPRAVVLDPQRGYIFWSDWGEEPKIERAGMDGTERTVIINTDIEWPNGLTIDYNASRLFWTDARLSYMHSCLLDGTNRTLILDGITPHPFALSVFQDTVYWTDWETKSIHAVDKYTGKVYLPVMTNLNSPMDIHVYTAERQPVREQNPCEGNGNCSHLCLLSPKPPYFSCACPTGVRLLEDAKTCAEDAQNILLLARRTDIRRISLDTPDYTAIVLPLQDVEHAIAIDYDPVDDYVYWTDDDMNAIQRVKLDGTGAETLIEENLGTPDGIAIDWIAGNMYWTDNAYHTIEAARLNGSSRIVLINEELDKPRDIAVHPFRGFIFWTDWGESPKIERAAMDGSDRVALLNDSVVWPNGITIDYDASLIYWGDGKLDNIGFMDLNGENRGTLKEYFTPHVFGFSLLGDYLYWSDWQSRTIERCHKLTGEDHEVLIEDLSDLMGLVAASVSSQKEWDTNNTCVNNNGGCSHLCFFRGVDHVCACPTGMDLLNDAQTCIRPDAFLLLCFSRDIQRISLETTYKNVEILTGVESANSLDFDFTDSMIYWSEQKDKKIRKAYMNGTGREDVIEFGINQPTSLAIDWVAHNIYFSDVTTKRIEVARLDGYSRRVLIWQNISHPGGLVLDPAEGYMYFVDWDAGGILERAFLDGTNRRKLLKGNGVMKGLTIDYIEKRLYWANLDQFRIESCDMFGGSFRVTLDTVKQPMGMTQFKDFVYWIDSTTRTVERANKSDGSNRTTIQKLKGDVADLIVFHASKQTGWNACGHNNSGCQHLCLSLPNTTSEWNYRCECPTHFELNPDGKTCRPPEEFLLYSLRNAVGRLHVDHSNHPDMVLPVGELKNVKVIEFDYRNNSVIWIDAKQKDIMISQINGLQRRTLVQHWPVEPKDADPANNPCDMALDPYGRRLYWTDAETNVINVTRLDGTPIGVVVEGQQRHPRLITLFAEKGMMFWFNNNSPHNSIERASLDGDHSFVIVSVGLGEVKAMTVDPASERLFWVDSYLSRIESVDVLGSTREVLVELSSGMAVGLTIYDNFVYWADKKRHSILKITKQKSGKMVPQLVKSRLDYLTDILAAGPPNLGHPCSHNNGGCSHLCIALDDGKMRCSCPLHLSLLDKYVCGAPPSCSPFEFFCSTMTENCLPLSWMCDGSEDCEDGYDEMSCPYCAETEFRCESGECLSMEQRCNGVEECSMGQNDEENCAPCLENQLECGSGECVSETQKCNDIWDCLDGSDELHCDNHVDGISSPDIKRPPVSHAAVGSLVSIGVISLVVIGVILLVRRCPWNQGSTSGSYVCDPVSNSYTFQLNHLGGEHSTQKYLSRHERRGGHVKSTNLHMCTSSSKSNAKLTSSSGLYERNRPTGASSMSSDHVSSSNSSYPKETLNPPPSPVTERSHCTTEIYYTPAHKMNTSVNTGRSYRHYKMRNIPPPPTPCSTDVCEDSEPIPQTYHKHTRRKKGYAKVPNIDPVNVDSEPYPPPPTPQYLSDSCPPSPSTGRSCFNPYPPPPSVATDSS